MKVVLCHGVFDLLHAVHLAHLERAKEMGDYLVVSVVPDRYITKRKPLYGEKARVKLLKALRCVDKVLLCNAPGPESLIRKLEPDLYVRGSDYRGKTMPESALLKRLGIKVRYTKSVPPRTSEVMTAIVNSEER